MVIDEFGGKESLQDKNRMLFIEPAEHDLIQQALLPLLKRGTISSSPLLLPLNPDKLSEYVKKRLLSREG